MHVTQRITPAELVVRQYGASTSSKLERPSSTYCILCIFVLVWAKDNLSFSSFLMFFFFNFFIIVAFESLGASRLHLAHTRTNIHSIQYVEFDRSSLELAEAPHCL